MKWSKLKKISLITPLSIFPLITFSCSTNQEIKKEEPVKEKTYEELERERQLKLYEQNKEYANDILRSIQSKFEKQIPELQKLNQNINDFYNNNYAKLLNKDLKTYYLNWKSELNNVINAVIAHLKGIIERKNSGINTNNDSYQYSFLLSDIAKALKNDNSSWIELFDKLNYSGFDFTRYDVWLKLKDLFSLDKLNDLFVSFKEDAWMIFDVKDKVDLDFLNSKWDFRQNYKTEEQKNKAKSEWDFVLLKLRTLANNSKDLVYENEDKNPSKTQELYEKYFTLVRDIVPTIASRKWDFDMQVKALTKYLVVKNFYHTGQKMINKVYLTLKNEESIFNCQAYSEFMFLSLNALGHKNNIQFNGDYYFPNGKWLPHVNLNYDNNGKVYVIDATFADQFNTKNPTLSDYNKVNVDINKNILIPIEEYQARLNAVTEFLGY
ncbi:Uncharacterised protein [Mycoplasmopsis columboralis]|uniref:Lipoprotein n=2 Tax=Mycoplasmopsis columboralis TaxID=171282 RepID=A0A449B5W2_9BACT|nr:hypothetical protein [Mycoplasmopsis columboralis]VEU75955.1 Uncharacterised protein [Mycoplasmopsis columboralis]